MCKRIIALFSSFVILFSCISLSYADDYASDNTGANLWDWLMINSNKWGSGTFASGFIQQCTGFFSGKVCMASPDSYHHCDYKPSAFTNGGRDDNGSFVWCKCKYCQKDFKLYTSFARGSGFGKSDLQQSYEAQVEELPATGYNSDGSLLWSPKLFSFGVTCVRSGTTYWAGCPHFEITGYWTGRYVDGDVVTDCNANSIFVRPKSGTSSFPLSRVRYCFRDVYPIAGFYTLLETVGIEGYYITSSGRTPFIKSFNPSSSVYYDAESSYSLDFLFPDGDFSSNLGFIAFSAQGSSPVYKIAPYDSLVGEINTTYNINSRPTSITGDYGIIGDNGQIIKVEGDKIVNETNNNYYNPVTGETSTITDWSYNYEDRSYTMTTESGDTVTITYGDENVVIKEGDTIYNVYYLVDGSGSENPDPGPDVPPACDHTWTEASRTDPTCSTPGKVTSTCSKCSQTKTETIPATGHTWAVDRTVQTTYDEEGNLLQQGYTIYKCSVCGEQYKDMEGTGPPGSEEEKSIWEKIGDFFGTIGGGFIDIINAVFGKLLDALIALAEMMMDRAFIQGQDWPQRGHLQKNFPGLFATQEKFFGLDAA